MTRSYIPLNSLRAFEAAARHLSFTRAAIELNVTHNVPEWGNQPVRFALEEDAAIMPGGKWDWIDGRQESFYLIR